MTRRHGRLKSAIALLAGLTIVGTFSANGAPITMTEANWNDEINVNAPLTASPLTGVNFARAATVNGKVQRLVRHSVFPGNVVEATTTTPPYLRNPNAISLGEGGTLGLIYFESNSRSCARVALSSCYFETQQSQSVSTYAASSLNSMKSKTSRLGTTILEYVDSNPTRTMATCTPGEKGRPSIIAGGSFNLRTGTTGVVVIRPHYTPMSIPTGNGDYVEEDGYILSQTLGWTYTTRITYNSISEINYALSELNLTIYAQPPLEPDPDEDTSTWSVNVNLSRAECGTSKPLDDGVVTETAGPPATINAVMDQVLAGDLEAIDAGTLDDAMAEAEMTETSELPTTTTTEEDEGDADTEGTSTSPSTSATNSTVPEIAQQTVTVTSERPDTTTSTTTSATTSRPSVSATRSTSVNATPPSSPPTSQPSTSTSAAPAIVIPDEPGTLASNARLEDVETITVDEEELDVVVVKGEEFPSDAKRGAQALEIWLGGGNAGTAWETFASDDPDDDGWRWAAINQKTGTVVYIR